MKKIFRMHVPDALENLCLVLFISIFASGCSIQQTQGVSLNKKDVIFFCKQKTAYEITR